MPKKLPVMKCVSDCGQCCGVAPATEKEYRRVQRYVEAQGVSPQRQGLSCPFFQRGKCVVYPVRPFSCQLFGHVAELSCPRGLNVNITPRAARRMVVRRGNTPRVLHELLGEGWKDELEEPGVAR